MTRRHGAIILGLSVACCAVAALVTWYLVAVRLPDPRTASRSGLFRWLALRDLDSESPEVQVALVNRLQVELQSHPVSETDATSWPLSDVYRDRLQKNGEVLKRVWFNVRVDEYAALPADRQMAFLEEQIAAISRWSEFDPSAGETGDSDNTMNDSATSFFGQIEGWIESAQGIDRERKLKAVQDGTVCWLATRDLAEQPRLVRYELAIRIVRELNAGMKLDEILLELSPPQREKLFANGELLLEAWLLEQAREYARLSESQRGPYLDERIDEVDKWGIFEVLAAGSDSSPASSDAASRASARAAGLMRFVALVDQWVERAPAEERADLVRLVAAVQRQLLWRQFLKPR